MPNRIIKESICYSDDIDKLTPFAETVFYRLIVNVDDYGRIDARPNFLKSRLFVTKTGITDRAVSDAVSQMANIGIVKTYAVGEREYIYFPKWSLHQRIRDSKAKYPEPPQETGDFSISPQVAASCGEPPPESNPNPNPNTPGENSGEFAPECKNTDILDGDDMFERVYSLYPKKKGKSEGKSAFMGYLSCGRKLKGHGAVRLNHLQIGFAVKCYASEVEHTDEQYIKGFGTFMGSQNGSHPILDYVDSSVADYEAYMLEKYGEEWRKIKFKYNFPGVKSNDGP